VKSDGGRHLPSWAKWLAAAAFWAVSILAVFVVAVFAIPPIDSWSRSDQLSLFQSAVGLAGFGGAVAGLIFAGRQIAERYGKPEIIITLDPDLLQMRQDDSYGARVVNQRRWFTFSLEIFNIGSAVATTWQLRVEIEAPFVLEVADSFGDHARSADGRSIVVHRTSPLFSDSEDIVGPYYICAELPWFDSLGDELHFELLAVTTTEFGQDEANFNGTLLIDRTQSPVFTLRPKQT
jgi:hypothetical protein